MLAFRVQFDGEWRDLAFVRCLRLTRRTGTRVEVPYLDAERPYYVPTCDRTGTTDKLGKLYTWDDAARGGVFVVIDAKEILHSFAMAPRYTANSAVWNMQQGMFRNPFVLDSRERPPYSGKCPCHPMV